ncbi:CHC2 zinc finger domain-containing protein, partial [Campylobacter upsaliensis]
MRTLRPKSKLNRRKIVDLQEFKSRIDIVRIIESFIVLRKEGAFYKANCPFH